MNLALYHAEVGFWRLDYHEHRMFLSKLFRHFQHVLQLFMGRWTLFTKLEGVSESWRGMSFRFLSMCAFKIVFYLLCEIELIRRRIILNDIIIETVETYLSILSNYRSIALVLRMLNIYYAARRQTYCCCAQKQALYLWCITATSLITLSEKSTIMKWTHLL